MKIFLDIDGVLNAYLHEHSSEEQRAVWQQDYALDQRLVDNFFHAVEQCFVRHNVIVEIVISSAWRKLFKTRGEFKRLPQWETWMPSYLAEDWRTKSLGRRGDEIDEWCHRNGYDGPIVVIDDEGCDLSGHQFLIKTAVYGGFSPLDGERLVNLVGVLNENRNYKRPPHGVSQIPAS